MKTLATSQGSLVGKSGWLIRLKNSVGDYGWGEVSPLNSCDQAKCRALLRKLSKETSRQELEEGLIIWPRALAFGIGAALGEIDGLIGLNSKVGWLKAPQSAFLLSNNKSPLKEIDYLVKKQKATQYPLTLKWKIAIESIGQEEALLYQILEHLPKTTRLRLDANAGLNFVQAQAWANHFIEEPKLEWLEQPLPIDDLEGISKLAKQIPVALDESLLVQPSLRNKWQSWQVRRPLLEGDPRVLLKELEEGIGFRMLSTTFETGIGLRWIHHLAALQQKGPTPTAPGLAPGWCPNSPLFSSDPFAVWEAA